VGTHVSTKTGLDLVEDAPGEAGLSTKRSVDELLPSGVVGQSVGGTIQREPLGYLVFQCDCESFELAGERLFRAELLSDAALNSPTSSGRRHQADGNRRKTSRVTQLPRIETRSTSTTLALRPAPDQNPLDTTERGAVIPVKRLGEFARASGHLLVEVSGDEETPVEGLSFLSGRRLVTDRDLGQVSPGDLFLCVEGYGVDGHDFAANAVEAGAVALCVERPTGVGVPEIVVTDSRRAAGPIAACFFGHPGDDMVLIGVTGTNGKTTTTYLLQSILEADGRRAGLIGTIGARVDGEDRETVGTTPEAIDLQRLLTEMRARQLEAVALEVTSYGLARNRVDGLHFDSAVFTNLSREHLGLHGGMDGYFAAKRSLFEPARSSKAAINVDDPYGRELMATTTMPTEGYGLANEAMVRAARVRLGRRGSEFTLATPVGELAMSTALAGSFNISNCLAAAAAALQVGVELTAVGEGIRRVKMVPGRFEFVDAGQPFSVVVDYAHTPDALESILAEGRRLSRADGGRLICLFGCGGGTDRGKRPLMGEVAARLAHRVVLTSDNPRQEDPGAIIAEIAATVPNPTVIEQRDKAIATAIEDARHGDVVVIAGKGHETDQQLADRAVPFDDREVARWALRAGGWNGGLRVR
jgi:UDP-N-acetylmuramoyl-L-alanyl-D-glutamate--2,6-diaminopimelate ligase